MFSCVILLFFITAVLTEHYPTYNRKIFQTPYPDYKDKWVTFPTETGRFSRAFLRSNKDEFPSDVTFTLYTQDNPQGLLITEKTLLNETSFYSDNPTKFITHGWTSSGTDESCVTIKDAYLKKGNFNVFIMDWSRISVYEYVITVAHIQFVGELYAKFLNELVDKKGVDPKKLHLVGHSLGAHISGLAARAVTKGKVSRVTGLDPAAPFFEIFKIPTGLGLNIRDADFVDIIHTCVGGYGMEAAIGHVDFYPNGGQCPQPGCKIDTNNVFDYFVLLLKSIFTSCSHSRSWVLFAESITQTEASMAMRCQSTTEISKEKCNGEKVAFGESASSDARGTYYLTTADKAPFLQHLDVEETN